MSKVRVLLADDHTLIRAGLGMVVESQPDLTVVGEASRPGAARDGGTRQATGRHGGGRPGVSKVRVLLADDHTLIRAGLGMVVESRPEAGSIAVRVSDDGRGLLGMEERVRRLGGTAGGGQA